MDLRLKSDGDISWQMASLFHGVLMELIKDDADYADFLHGEGVHPYSQHLEKREDGWHWVISFLNDEAYKHIWRNKLASCDEFDIRSKDIKVSITGSTVDKFSYEDLNDIFKVEKPEHKFSISFLTPTSFKSSGQYVYFPDIRLIYQSIMNKYSKALDGESVYDEETLSEMVESTAIKTYNLRTYGFSMEGITIPAFLGTIGINIDGSDTMAAFAKMLFKFSEYSGIGIKASLGMGAVRVTPYERRGFTK